MARTRAQKTGDQGEQQALDHLERVGGHRCVARNFSGQRGEVDLITLDGETLVFVEVRARNATAHGRPEETVDWRKRARLLQAAQQFLARYPTHAQRRCRFDVVALTPEGLRWIPDAFRPDETGFWS